MGDAINVVLAIIGLIGIGVILVAMFKDARSRELRDKLDIKDDPTDHWMP